MTALSPQAAPAAAPLRLSVHLIVALAIAVVTPFTALAWPFAILTGMVIGSDTARRMRGEPTASFTSGLAVTGGVLGMLFFGAIVGGIIAFAVVALTSFSERAAAYASATDRGVARILLFLVPLLMWLVVFPLLGLNVDIRVGS